MSNESEFINKINQKKGKNPPLFDKSKLSSIHEKVINRVKRTNDNPNNESNIKINGKAQAVINADLKFRDSVKELIMSLADLNDPEIAVNLLGEHIIMLNSIFTDFEKIKK